MTVNIPHDDELNAKDIYELGREVETELHAAGESKKFVCHQWHVDSKSDEQNIS